MSLIIDDLCKVENPTITVLTPSLNHGRFLNHMIETVLAQSFRRFEHIVIDGGSTDSTINILKGYPHIRWVSGRENSMVEAYRKGLAMARGQYIIQCCVSDGFLDRHWFRKCVEVLDKDKEVSLVWGFAQSMSEEGDLLNVSFQEFFIDPPPQKQDFLGFWLATGFTFPEGNYCVRTNVMKEHFPDTRSEAYFQDHAALGFIYRFMTQGYCPFLIPNVANFGREHWDQRSRRLRDIEGPAVAMYYRRVKDYKSKLLKGELTHYFRAGDSEVIGKMRPQDLWRLRRQIWRHTLLRSRLLRRDPYTLALRIGQRFLERFGY